MNLRDLRRAAQRGAIGGNGIRQFALALAAATKPVMRFSEIRLDLDGPTKARLRLAFKPARCRDIAASEPIGRDPGPQRDRSLCRLLGRVEAILLTQGDRKHVPGIRRTGVSSEHFSVNLLCLRHCASLVEPYSLLKDGADFRAQHYAGLISCIRVALWVIR
jgi:hypothetical protein